MNMEEFSNSTQTSLAKRLEGKVAIITGGASGIGRATAKIFARNGAKVVVADVQDDLGRSLEEEALGLNQTISFLHCDVTKDDDVKNLVDNVVFEHGKLDIMFSNAGILGNYMNTSILTANDEELKNVFGVNVFGAFFCAKHAARVMIPAKRGSIIFTASSVSEVAGVSPHTYTSTKHALVGLAKNLCVELGQHGIRVNCVSPHATHTPIYKGVPLDDEVMNLKVAETSVLKGVTLEADDVGEIVVFLGSDESKYVSGVNLLVDGGYSTTNPSLGVALANALLSHPKQ